MKAEILAIGSELIDPLRVESNAAALTGRLLEVGIEVVARMTVADDRAALESVFRSSLARADLVIATGGLGPTADDLTREAAAAALQRPLVRDARLIEGLRARFARYGRVMASVNEKQADLIEGAVALFNRHGTAPGQRLEIDGRILVLLPGPPAEMQAMFDEQVLPELRQRGSGRVFGTRVLKIAAMPESEVEQLAAPVYSRFDNPRTTILGGPAMVELHLTGHGRTRSEAEQRLEELAGLLRACLPNRIFSEDGRGLHELVAQLLVERGLTLATAESCTGGLLASLLTEVPGASRFLERGFVTYSNRSKSEAIGVDAELLSEKGAVSDEVARAMASGARRVSGADIGIGITGIAGPDGATADKPLGLVFMAIDGAVGERAQRSHFSGDRHRVRRQAVHTALELLRRGLLGLDRP